MFAKIKRKSGERGEKGRRFRPTSARRPTPVPRVFLSYEKDSRRGGTGPCSMPVFASFPIVQSTRQSTRGKGKERAPVPSYVLPHVRVFSIGIYIRTESPGGIGPYSMPVSRVFLSYKAQRQKKAARRQRQDAGPVLCLTPVLRAFISYGRAVAGGDRPTFYIGFTSFPIVRKDSRSGELAPSSIPASRVFLSYGRAVAEGKTAQLLCRFREFSFVRKYSRMGETGPSSTPVSRVFLS